MTDPTPDRSETADRRPADPVAVNRLGQLTRAALEAEIETGERETTDAEARRSLIRRLGIIIAGSVVVVTGLILLLIPGPGMVVTAIGLAILAREVPFASRLLERVRKRLPQDADGKLPRSAIVTMVVMCTGALGLSLWWTLHR